MNKYNILTAAALTLIWIMLSENLTIATVLTAITVSICSVFIYHLMIPSSKSKKNLKLIVLAIYPFYLIGQIYLSAFNAIKLILTGADVDIIEVKTQLTDNFLKTILANSFTLTPGTISLELKEDTISLFWLRGKKQTHQDAEKAGELTKHKLEKILLKAER